MTLQLGNESMGHINITIHFFIILNKIHGNLDIKSNLESLDCLKRKQHNKYTLVSLHTILKQSELYIHLQYETERFFVH